MRPAGAAVGLVFLFGLVGCQQPRTEQTNGGMDVSSTRTDAASSDEEKIAEAMSAAPEGISRNATIMDWPREEGGEFRQLRAGTNDWVCFPSTPRPRLTADPGQDPMCLDSVFQAWAESWATRTTPGVQAVGFGYMLRGDVGVSNTDPFAEDSTADNHWVRTGPHLMLVAPPGALTGLNTTPGPTPWVMWAGTPYEHVMMPTP